jgi:hypothetical protein
LPLGLNYLAVAFDLVIFNFFTGKRVHMQLNVINFYEEYLCTHSFRDAAGLVKE